MSDLAKGIDAEKAIRQWDETEAGLHAARRKAVADPQASRIAPFRIFGPLYYVGGKDVCAHLLDSGDGLILFDSGFPDMIPALVENVAALGFRVEDIRHIIHSHEHFDHFGATHALQSGYGSRTYIHRLGAETFRIRPHHTELHSAYSPEAALFRPDVEFSDGDELRIGNTVIRCVHNPGHSAGSASFFFDVAGEGRILRAGLCGIGGVLPLHAGRLLRYGIPLETWDEYLASIGKLEGERVDLALDTHPRPNGILDRRQSNLDDRDANHFIDAGAWRRTLDDYRTRFHDFVRKQKDYSCGRN